MEDIEKQSPKRKESISGNHIIDVKILLDFEINQQIVYTNAIINWSGLCWNSQMNIPKRVTVKTITKFKKW